MGVYLGVSAVCVSLALMSIADSRSRKVLCLLNILIMVLFAGLRYQCWTDWDSYFEYFSAPGNTYHDFEAGYVIWNGFFRLLTSTYNLYLLATYAAVFLLKYLASKKLAGRYLGLCCIVYLAQLLSSGGLRQFIAVGIITFSVKFLMDGKYKKYYLLCILACLFHRTAFVCFIFPFVKVIKRKVKLRHIVLIFMTGAVFHKFQVFYYLLNMCKEYLKWIQPVYYRIGYYMDTLKVEDPLISAGMLKRVVLILGMAYMMRFSEKYRSDEGFRGMTDISFKIYLAGFFLSLFVGGQFSRINVYFYSQEAFVECFLVAGLNKRDYKILALAGLITMNIVIMLYNLKYTHPALFIPYRLCF